MSDSLMGELMPPGAAGLRDDAPQAGAAEPSGALPLAAQYGLSLLFVALATGLAFVVDHLMAAPNLTLIFVLPVMAAATFFGWGPSLIAVAAGVLAFDFFFTEPYYSIRIASPSDLWATGLLLVIAAIVSTLAAESRRRTAEARRAVEQAQALQNLAHLVIQARPKPEIIEAAATTLTQIFRAPAVVFARTTGALAPVASAGEARITSAEEEAAQGALNTKVSARAETYPYDRSVFDFWPVTTPQGGEFVIGVDFTRSGRDRPAKPERFVEIVGGYLAAAVSRPSD